MEPMGKASTCVRRTATCIYIESVGQVALERRPRLEKTGRAGQPVAKIVGIPKGPCTQIVYTLAAKYPNRDYFKAKVCLLGVHGPLGYPAASVCVQVLGSRLIWVVV